MCSCTPPGTSQVYGQTMPILMTASPPPAPCPPALAFSSSPGPAAAGSRSGSRSSTKTRCSMCQSSGCAAMPASKVRASSCVIAAILSCLSPSAGTGISG